MHYEAIDHVILPVTDLETAAEPFKRLGLTLFPTTRHPERGTQNTGFFVGDEAGCFYVELLSIADRDVALRSTGAAYVQAVESATGLLGVVLRTSDLAGAVNASYPVLSFAR
jgi:catechol 2,3-dioxygenase-like lactoylglutathione lyase family enzyme